MKLQTEIPLKKAPNQIDYGSRLLVLGSCFANHIGGKLDYFKFKTVKNPFGILFHPFALETLIERAITKEVYTQKDIFLFNEHWHCFDGHSELCTGSKEKLLQSLNTGLEKTHLELTKASHMVITLGTAWGYRNKANGKIVANCHKIPQQEFAKELLSQGALVQSLETIIGLVRSVNKSMQIIFTVSPVRHLKDGFVENQRSKANLIGAVHEVVRPLQGSHYFPAYEIMMDELRDYRFYAEDMVHPNTLAINYIWEKFKVVWITEAVYPVMDRVDAIQKDINHSPFYPQSEQHQSFLRALRSKITALSAHYPFMEFTLPGV